MCFCSDIPVEKARGEASLCREATPSPAAVPWGSGLRERSPGPAVLSLIESVAGTLVGEPENLPMQAEVEQ